MSARLRAVAAIASPCILVLASCGGAGSAADSLGGDSGWREAVIEEAPVADPAEISKGTELRDVHESGKLVYGRSKTQKLCSQRNPVTNKLEGFDATLALLLAKFLTGEPKVEEKIVTSETREALLVEAVYVTAALRAGGAAAHGLMAMRMFTQTGEEMGA